MPKSTNTKVIRMLKALAILLKDEDKNLLIKAHEIINDDKGGDGYDFNFLAEVENCKACVQGASYRRSDA